LELIDGVYTGEVNASNVPHGKGRMQYDLGLVLEGVWSNGTFVVNADLPTSPRSPISGEPRINVKSQDFAGTSSKCKNSHRRDLKNVSNLKKQEKVSMARTRSKSKFEEELKQKAGVANSDPKEELD
jgi:hypothetical protein